MGKNRDLQCLSFYGGDKDLQDEKMNNGPEPTGRSLRRPDFPPQPTAPLHGRRRELPQRSPPMAAGKTDGALTAKEYCRSSSAVQVNYLQCMCNYSIT